MRLAAVSMIALFAAAACAKKKGGGSSSAAAVPPEPVATAAATASGTATGTAGDDGTQAGEVSIVTVDNGSTSLPADELKLASRLSVVPPQTTTAGMINVQALRLLGGATDYDNARTDVFVNDAASRDLGNVNLLLCLLAGTAYTEKVGAGDYLATVDASRCSSGSGPTAARFVVNSARAAKTSPLEVKFWADVTSSIGQGSHIAGKARILKGATAANPYGIFRIDFGIFPYGSGGAGDPGASISIESYETTDGQTFVRSYYKENEGSAGIHRLAVSFALDGDGALALGKARVDARFPDVPARERRRLESDLSVAFDGSLYGELDNLHGGMVCRDRARFYANVMRYGVFDAVTGGIARPAASELTVRAMQGDSYVYGTVNANSFALPTASAGQSVEVIDPWAPTAAPRAYTVAAAPGVLRKSVTRAIPGAIAEKMLFQFVDGDQSVGVRWNASASRWEKVATITPDGLHVTFQAPTAYVFGLPAVSLMGFGGGGLYAAELDVDAGEALVSLTATATETVSATFASDQTFWCVADCLKANLTPADVSGATSTLADPTDVATMIEYEFDATTQTLEYQGAPVAFTGGSGDAIAAMSLISDADHQAHKDEAGYFAAAASYATHTWSIDTTPESRYLYLVGVDGAPFIFADKVRLSYVHAAGNDYRGRYSELLGAAFELTLDATYGVFGYPQFGEEDGIALAGIAIASGTTVGGYKLKILNLEERMPRADETACAALSFDDVPALPEADLLVAAAVGTMPVVAGEPAVVDGVVQ